MGNKFKKSKLTYDSHEFVMLYMTVIYSYINNIMTNRLPFTMV